MSVENILIDCDPGHDDAVAIFMALGSPQALRVIGITTVAGNASVALTERNARFLCQLAGRSDIPVRAGCARPMVERGSDATDFHGESGLDGLPMQDIAGAPDQQHGVDFMIDCLTNCVEPITVVCLGPLTNLAMALVKAPGIIAGIKEIVFMGGARRAGGNVTPCATFNVVCDPHAAHVVFDSGCPLVVIGLDASSQVIVNAEGLDAIAKIGNPIAAAAHQMLDFFNRRRVEVYGYSSDNTSLNDPCVIAYLLERSLFSGKKVNIAIEYGSALTKGMTVVDLWGTTGRTPNALWLDQVDARGVMRQVCDALRHF